MLPNAQTLWIIAAVALLMTAVIMRERRPVTTVAPVSGDMARTIQTLSNKIDDLEEENARLRNEIQDLRVKITRLEARDEYHKPGGAIVGPQGQVKTTPPLMLVLGTDSDINDREENALRQSGLDYRVIKGADGQGATLQDFIDECNRRRNDDSMPDYIDFAMHGIEEPDNTGQMQGVMGFRDRHVSWRELAVQLTGVKVVVLGACETTKLADQLAGIVGHVISYTQGVDKTDALRFSRAFWTKVREGKTTDVAYVEAKRTVPTVRNMIDMQ
jgi:hypothetical protein